MKATRHLIAGFIVLAGLGYASAAIGQIFDAGHIFRPAPAANGPAAPQNNKVAPDLPNDDVCNVDRLKASLDKMLAQRKALKRDWKTAREKYKTAKAHHDSHAKVAHLKGVMDKLRKRIKSLDSRIGHLRSQINRCKPGAAPPVPDLNDPELDEDDALIDEPSLGIYGAMKISCRVPEGTETRSVLFRNIGDKLIPSGTPVTWSVKASGQEGQFSLPHSLAVGADLTAADLLKLGVPGNTSCRSQLGPR